MKPAKETFRADRLSYFAAAALFLFFLLYSAPHQVHHAFDDHPSPCLTFAVAKGCSLDSAPTVNFFIAPTATERLVQSFEVWVPYFTPSPFSQRAPPTV
jgi:hypothetical protein